MGGPEPRKMGPRRVGAGASHDSRELQTCTFDGPGASNTTKIRKDQQEREKRMKIVAGKGKRARNFVPPPFGAPPFVVQEFNIQKLAEVEIGRSRNWPKSNWPNSKKKLAEVDIGRSRPRSKLTTSRTPSKPGKFWINAIENALETSCQNTCDRLFFSLCALHTRKKSAATFVPGLCANEGPHCDSYQQPYLCGK